MRFTERDRTKEEKNYKIDGFAACSERLNEIILDYSFRQSLHGRVEQYNESIPIKNHLRQCKNEFPFSDVNLIAV